MSEAQKYKDLGNKAFQAGNFQESVELFTKAIEINPNEHVFFSNRSGAYASLKQYENALEDATVCVALKPDWAKGYQRKGLAEFYLQKYEDAEKSYQEGLKIEPNNQQLQEGLKRVQEENGPMGPGFQKQMFAKLLTNPKTAGYMKDPAFVQKLQMIQKNPQMMQMFMQDPQIQEAFQVMFGMGQPEDQQHPGPGWEDISPKEEPQNQQPKKEEPKQEQHKPQQTQQQKTQQQQQVNQAEEEKNLGNNCYKNRNFQQALIHYNKAIEMDSNEVLFYNNKAAVYIELQNFQEAMSTVDKALEVYQNSSKKDFSKLAKLYARKAGIYKHMEQYQQSIEFYEKSLLEDNQYKVKEELKAVQKIKKQQDELAYINPELAEEHNNKARDLFKQGNFPAALKEYEEAIRRSPKDPKYHNNQATCLLKLMDFNLALKAAEKALEIDPTFYKALAKKGNAHFGMKEYHKALEAFQKGLNHEPENQEFKEGIQKTQMKLYSSHSETKEEQEERSRHAMADPEIQRILQDPTIMNILRKLQESPNDKETLRALQDQQISAKIQKLIQAGILRTG